MNFIYPMENCLNVLIIILKICEVIDTGTDLVTANDNYIDASSNEKIITCPGTKSCYSSAHEGSSNEPKYYINGEDKLSIITCNGSGCTSSPGSLLYGYTFISGTDLSKKNYHQIRQRFNTCICCCSRN